MVETLQNNRKRLSSSSLAKSVRDKWGQVQKDRFQVFLYGQSLRADSATVALFRKRKHWHVSERYIYQILRCTCFCYSIFSSKIPSVYKVAVLCERSNLQLLQNEICKEDQHFTQKGWVVIVLNMYFSCEC